ncbi:putative quinol monooxygenase [Streptomyces sp. KR55]|uniref:putative quinol monooxygenase n=1 Tax=Streptomyces sp. KR55 TaxID=3457425 RepID=UPI003FCF9A82
MTQLPEPGFVTFDTLTAEVPRTADELVEALVTEAAGRLRHSRGFIASRVHVSDDRRTVIHRCLWRDAADHHAAADRLKELANRPGVQTAKAFGGTPAPGLHGPQLGAQPGRLAVATRYLHPGSYDALADLLARSGAWKRHHKGFISATPHITPDGLTFVNYAMWATEDSYRAWMADPRISEGQEEIARLEAAPPEYVLCTVAADIAAA